MGGALALLSKKPILSVPQLQGAKSNIHAHFRIVDKQWIGISFPSIQHVINLEVRNSSLVMGL